MLYFQCTNVLSMLIDQPDDWGTGNPKHQNCAVLWNHAQHKWDDHGCDFTRRFVCEKLDGYENGYKYHAEAKAYDEAQSTCESEGASLVEITSADEQTILSGNFR